MAAEHIPIRRRGLRRRIAVRIAFGTAALLPVFSAAHAQSPMVQGWMAVNSVCKGSLSDDAKTQAACKRRDDLSAKLKKRGCVYQEDGDWWKCPHG